MAITDWPETEQPRERLLSQGAAALSEAELLAIFLRTGTAGKTAVDLARDLLSEFGSLRSIFEADLKQFCRIHGLGKAKYTQLQAMLQLSKRYLGEKITRKDVITNSLAMRKYLTARLRSYEHEVFACIHLDSCNRMIHYEELFHGTIDFANIHPRIVVKTALAHNTAAIIFAHNHPSGSAQPSQADQIVTKRLKDALELVDITVLDHFVVGDGEITSFAEQGLL